MAYVTEDLYKLALKIIKEDKLHFITDVIAMMPCSEPTFYDHFPTGSKQFKELKDLIGINAISLKRKLRNKWEESDNATLQLALYKLTGTEEERIKISQAYNEVKIGGKKEEPIKLSIAQIDEILNNI